MKSNWRIGFCCKYMHPNFDLSVKEREDIERKLNGYGITVKSAIALKNESKSKFLRYMFDLISDNLEGLYNTLQWLSECDQNARMFRITSDLLPLFTHEVANYVYEDNWVKQCIELGLENIGKLARDNGIRLSFHPAQFCVLNSGDRQVLANSIADFEYHYYLADCLGFVNNNFHPHGFCINVHVGGKQAGVEGLVHNFKKLPEHALNVLTIENDEFCFGLPEIEPLFDKVAVVMDVHHWWITSGFYVDPKAPKVQSLINSWRGVRPKMHLSMSRQDLISDQDGFVNDAHKPQLDELLLAFTRNKLRAHSDMIWSKSVADWALTFLPKFDIQVEAKHKNCASFALLSYAKRKL